MQFVRVELSTVNVMPPNDSFSRLNRATDSIARDRIAKQGLHHRLLCREPRKTYMKDESVLFIKEESLDLVEDAF